MSKYASKKFWTDTIDRAVSTFAQAAVGAIGVNATGILDINLVEVASISGLAALVSLLMSIGVRGRGEEAPPAIILPVGAGPEADPEFADDPTLGADYLETVAKGEDDTGDFDMADSVDDDEEPGKYGA